MAGGKASKIALAQRLHSRAAAPAGRGGRRCWLQLALCVLLGLGALERQARADNAQSFQIIVHPESPLTSVGREFLADAFLKRTSRWPSGEPIHPVDLRFDSPVRAQFSNAILKRSVAAVRSYWQQRIFSGRGVPPPEVDSEVAAVRYVKKNKGGVGYVSSNTDTREVKVLAVR